MKRSTLIVAGGSGSRMGGELPKQYQYLEGKPLIVHTLERFRRFDPQMQLVVVMAPLHRPLWEELVLAHEAATDVLLAEGGSMRYNSVKNGLMLVEDGVLVAIHDAVRPFVDQATIGRCFEAAGHDGSGIPVIEMEESMRMCDDQGGSVPIDRSKLRRVQTPQVFRSDLIKEAYRQSYNPSFTDDASVYEAMHGKVTLVEGNRENIKITTPGDLSLAKALIRFVE